MWDIFVSHSKADRAFVSREIVEFLESNGISTWLDEDDIAKGELWEEQIREGLQSTRCFVLVMSKNSAQSEWVKSEVHWAADKRLDYFVPVLIDDCDPIDFHLKLPRLQYVDYRIVTDDSRVQLLRALNQKLSRTTADVTARRQSPRKLPAAPKILKSWLLGALIVVVAIVLLSPITRPWGGEPIQSPPQFKDVSVGTKELFEHGQISIQFAPVFGNADAVEVSVHLPDGSTKSWTQNGIGAPTEFTFSDKSYLLHITKIVEGVEEEEAQSVTVAVVEKQ